MKLINITCEMKKETFLIGGILILHLFFYFVVLPYVQQTVNSHMNVGSLLRSIFFGFAGVFFMLSIYFFIRNRNILTLVLQIFLAISLCFWAVVLGNVYCEGCAVSG